MKPSDIAALGEKIEKFNGEMAAVSTDFVKLNQLTAEKEETEKLLEEKMDQACDPAKGKEPDTERGRAFRSGRIQDV